MRLNRAPKRSTDESRDRAIMRRIKKKGGTQDSDTLLTCTSVHESVVVLNRETMDHVQERHPEVLRVANLYTEIKATIESPEFIAAGRTDEVVALRRISETHKFLAVFYVEGGKRKTFFITSKPDSFKRRGVTWPK